MQRGSSVRSHHNGGTAGASRTCAPSLQPSAESRSHMQSAASTGAASSKRIAATASAWRRVLMKAKSKSTAPMRPCNKSPLKDGGGGVKPGGAGCRIVGEERVHGGVRLHPPLAYGVNAGLPTSIPTQMPVSQPRPETLGLWRLGGVRVPRGLESGSSRVRHRRDSVDTTAESRGFFALGRCR